MCKRPGRGSDRLWYPRLEVLLDLGTVPLSCPYGSVQYKQYLLNSATTYLVQYRHGAWADGGGIRAARLCELR